MIVRAQSDVIFGTMVGDVLKIVGIYMRLAMLFSMSYSLLFSEQSLY